MKISEARKLFNTQIKEYREQQTVLSKQKEELEKKIKSEKDGNIVYANEAATLELTIRAVEEKKNEYQKYMDKIMEKWTAIANMEATKQQGEAMEEYAVDMGKIMEVARRIMQGGIVPPTDEKKLMEYSMELYQAAKNIGAMMKQKEREEYDSLWKDEEEKPVQEDPMEVADRAEAPSGTPVVVEVADTMASANGETV